MSAAVAVRVEEHGDVRVLALARPPVNAVDLELVEALSAVVLAAGAERSCRAVVVTGAAGVFCAGIDTKRIPAYDAALRARMLRGVNRTVLALYALAKPLVAAISGHALGAGLVLALTADVRLAARGAFRLGLTEGAAGIPFPACPMALVKAELAPETARRLVLSSATAPPDSPLFSGVVDRVVGADSLLEAALAEARSLCAQPSFAAVKQQLRAATVARMRQIVDEDDEPLLAGWVERPT